MRPSADSHGRVSLGDEFRVDRPPTAVNNNNIDAMYHIVKTDMDVTYHEIRA